MGSSMTVALPTWLNNALDASRYPTLVAPSDAEVSAFLLNPLTLGVIFLVLPSIALFGLIFVIMPVVRGDVQLPSAPDFGGDDDEDVFQEDKGDGITLDPFNPKFGKQFPSLPSVPNPFGGDE